VALCMKQLEPLVLVQNTTSNVLEVANKTPLNCIGNEMAPLFSIAQEERLDIFLAKLKSTFEANQINDIPTSAVMELYEYKVQYLLTFSLNYRLGFIYLYIVTSF